MSLFTCLSVSLPNVSVYPSFSLYLSVCCSALYFSLPLISLSIRHSLFICLLFGSLPNLSVYPSLSLYLSVSCSALYFSLPLISLSICLSPSLSLSVCSSLSLPLSLSVCSSLSPSLSICLFVSLSPSLSLFLSVYFIHQSYISSMPMMLMSISERCNLSAFASNYMYILTSDDLRVTCLCFSHPRPHPTTHTHTYISTIGRL